MHEHPTQALLDLLTIREKRGHLEGLSVAIVGDIAHSRVARSNIAGMRKMGMSVTVAGPPTLIPPGVEELGVKVARRLEDALRDVDVIMMLRLQQERMTANYIPSLREYSRLYGLSLDKLRGARDDVLIMHPGPVNRGIEMAPEVADGPYSVILEQVANGVAVRMAILYLLSGRQERGGLIDGSPDPERPRRRSRERAGCPRGRADPGRPRGSGRAAARGTGGHRDDRRGGPRDRPGLHRYPRPPARAGAGVQGDRRQRYPGGGRRRVCGGRVHGQYAARQRHACRDGLHPRRGARPGYRPGVSDRRGDPRPRRTGAGGARRARRGGVRRVLGRRAPGDELGGAAPGARVCPGVRTANHLARRGRRAQRGRRHARGLRVDGSRAAGDSGGGRGDHGRAGHRPG